MAIWIVDSAPLLIRSSRYVVGMGWTSAETIGVDIGGTPPQIAIDNSDKATAVWTKKLLDIEAARLE